MPHIETKSLEALNNKQKTKRTEFLQENGTGAMAVSTGIKATHHAPDLPQTESGRRETQIDIEYSN